MFKAASRTAGRGATILLASSMLMLTATIPSGPSVRVHADAPPTCIGTAGRSMPPPAGFDPLSATTDQLQCYGFPRRPTDARGLAVWTTAMSHALHYVDPQPGSLPGDTRPLPAPATVLGNLNSTWAGYVAFTKGSLLNKLTNVVLKSGVLTQIR